MVVLTKHSARPRIADSEEFVWLPIPQIHCLITSYVHSAVFAFDKYQAADERSKSIFD
jgi:hypothetical protein